MTERQHDGWAEPPLPGSPEAVEDAPVERLAADAPPGDTYGTQQAAQILGVSARRVSQFVQEGRLDAAQRKPLRVTAQSVHDLREARRSPGRDQRVSLPPESVAEQVERLVALVTTEQRRALEAGEHLLAEVTAQRDEYRAERDLLRAEIERLREVPPVASEPPRRRWWQRGT